MEVNNEDIQFFLKVKLTDKESLHKKFSIWFTSRLGSAELHEFVDPDIQPEEFIKYQKAAEALADKVDWMSSFYNTHSDMDSVIRMLVRICDLGTKKIPDKDKVIEENAKYWNRGGKQASYRNAVAGLGKTVGHFRWNCNTVYTLHPIHVAELCKILRELDYFTLRPEAVLLTQDMYEI